MLFSSLVFLFLFLPIVLLFYYVFPQKIKNSFLFFASLVFFAWGGVSYSSILIFSILINYVLGILINNRKRKKLYLGIGVGINLSLLIVFKYANFIIENINALLTSFDIPSINNPSILLPIGISFYTFQSLSYLIDVYRKTCAVQKNPINLGLYIALFPQLIAGPIVRYYDIQKQIKSRVHSFEKFKSGVIRFVIGFGKKVIIANSMAYIADEVFALPADSLGLMYSWIGIIAYSLQIYYDFSGYSDMAIGLARMFGFELLENFNFPYIAKSIQDFWRRWHISLSNWFRDYLYIPLGGNRKGGQRTIVNLFIVFFVTGFWHGANWNFLVWGLVHGLFLVLERGWFGRFLAKQSHFVKSGYTLLIVIFAWVLFRSETLEYGIHYMASMLAINTADVDSYLIYKLINRESIIIFIIGVLGAFGFFPWVLTFLKTNKFVLKHWHHPQFEMLKGFVLFVFVFFVLVYAVGDLVIGSYNPFIYFRF